MNTLTEINDVPVSAPMFKGVDAELLTSIIGHISKASYHFADDSGGEWGSARRQVGTAARLIAQAGLPYAAISALYSHKPQLMGIDILFDAILKETAAIHAEARKGKWTVLLMLPDSTRSDQACAADEVWRCYVEGNDENEALEQAIKAASVWAGISVEEAEASYAPVAVYAGEHQDRFQP